MSPIHVSGGRAPIRAGSGSTGSRPAAKALAAILALAALPGGSAVSAAASAPTASTPASSASASATGGSAAAWADSTQLRFVIRVDDILSRSTTILPRSIEPFQEVVEARGGVVTWGVMPHRFIEGPNLDGALAAELRASAGRGHEISLHGYEHVCMVCGQSSHEMSCTSRNLVFDYDRQKGIVQRGLDLMQEKLGVEPTSFIPPGHIGNDITWQVLDDFGFPVLSTVMSSGPVVGGLINLPPLGEYTWALTESNYQENLDASLADIRERAASSGYYVLMMHDPFIRRGYGNGITLRWMGELLDSLNAEFGERVRYQTLTEAAEWLRDPAAVQVEEEIWKGPWPGMEAGFELLANYPNPFNPSTVVRFRLARAAKVRLSLHDAAGREIRLLLEGVRGEGAHEVSVDLQDLPSGMYLYALQMEGRRQTRAMTLIR